MMIFDKLGKIDVDKLVPFPTDLSKLSNVVKNYVVKKPEYKAKIKDIEDKIPSIVNLATNSAPNAKINEIKGEIPSITSLTATDAFNVVENKITDVSDLVGKPDYDAKISAIKKKIFYYFWL